jgi:hypothetical protein
MTLRDRIVEHILMNPGRKFTNDDLYLDLGMSAPKPSIRRATLKAMMLGQIQDGGPVSYNASVVTYVAPESTSL